MGKTNIYGEANSVFVQVHATSVDWMFGFRTKIDATERGLLGHTLATAATKPVIYGLNSPTPARYKKEEATYSVTSYADQSKTSAAIAGYRRVKPVKLRAAKSGKSKCVTVPFKGALYTWLMNLDVYSAITIAELNSLGVLDAVNTLTAAKNQIWGGNGNSSKPPKAKKVDTASGNTFTTFYDESLASLPSGWTPAGGGGYTL